MSEQQINAAFVAPALAPEIKSSWWRLQSVTIDGWTYVLIAFFGAWASAFASDDAAKWIAAVVLFWLKWGCASISASLLALKMYRSTQFADHRQEVRARNSGDTQHFVNPAK